MLIEITLILMVSINIGLTLLVVHVKLKNLENKIDKFLIEIGNLDDEVAQLRTYLDDK